MFASVLGLVTKNIEQRCEERKCSSHFLPSFRDQKPETTVTLTEGENYEFGKLISPPHSSTVNPTLPGYFSGKLKSEVSLLGLPNGILATPNAEQFPTADLRRVNLGRVNFPVIEFSDGPD